MSESLVRKVVLAALKGERGDGGWLKIDAPKATDKEISLAIMEAAERGLVKACNVSHMQSPYPEWRLVGPTGASAQFVREPGRVKSNGMKKKVAWSRGENIAAVAVVVTVVVGLFFPEVRRFLRLEKPAPAPVALPQVQVPTRDEHPAAPAPVAPQSKEPPAVNSEAADSIAELRQSHHVARIREIESGETLSEVPAGSFGFVSATFFSFPFFKSLAKLELKAHGSFGDLEIHKLADGQ